jgi:hypothetical protein
MVDDDLELLAPIVAEDKWHPNFGRVAKHASAAEIAVLRDWARGFRDRDGKFVREFQTTFNSSFWELYLFALLRDSGCSIDLAYDRPDFVVTGGPLGTFVAEAVIASNPEHGLPEWAGTFDRDEPDRETLLDLACLRLSQAIAVKHGKWASYSKLKHCVDQPYIICVAPFEQPGGFQQGTQAIDRVLFAGPGPLLLKGDDGVSRVLGTTTTESVFKPGGARIPLGIFARNTMPEVSAVLFSSLATWSKLHALAKPDPNEVVFVAVRASADLVPHLHGGPGNAYEETLVDGAHIFLNPHARRPIDPGPWLDAGFCAHQYRPTGTLSAMQPATLIQRSAHRLVAYDDPSEIPVQHNVPANVQTFERQAPPDGVFFGGPALVGLADSVELTLYEGWTLWIGRDITDNDWACIAKHGTYLSLQEFTNNEGGFITSFTAKRDDAIQEARERIDMWGDRAAD